MSTWVVEENKTCGKTVKMSVTSGNKQSEVVTTMYGAHVISWCEQELQEGLPISWNDMIFCSKKAVLDGSKAIRGGIPVIFPQFSDFGPLSRHGFCRTSDQWEIDTDSSSPSAQDSDTVSVTFVLRPNATTAVWKHKFALAYTVCLSGAESSTLTCTMSIKNNNDTDKFSFTAALHTYFLVGDISCTSVVGLHKGKYMDQLRNRETFTEEEKSIVFKGETDRVYYAAPSCLSIVDTTLKRQINLAHSGFKDAVVWNPWDKAKGMSDMDDEEYKTMVCVEAAVVETPIELAPSSQWNGIVKYSTSSLTSSL